MKSIYKIDSNLVGFSFKYNELVSFYIYTELKYNFVCYIMLFVHRIRVFPIYSEIIEKDLTLNEKSNW